MINKGEGTKAQASRLSCRIIDRNLNKTSPSRPLAANEAMQAKMDVFHFSESTLKTQSAKHGSP